MSPEMKNYINKLKAEGDLRLEGLDTLNNSKYTDIALALIVVLIISPFTNNIYVLVCVFYGSFLIIKFLFFG